MSDSDGNEGTRESPWKYFRMLSKVGEYILVQCGICRKRIALTGGPNKILSIHMFQNHHEYVPMNHRLTLIEREVSKGPKIKRSYVWHYFDRLGDTAKCRVCQYEIKNKNGNTSSLIRHLEQVHRLKKGTMVSDFKNLPTMPRQSSNMGSCMKDRVFRSFEEGDKGIWRCKFCSYALGTRKLLTMFQHLKSVHWKANGPAYNEFIMENNRVLAETRIPEEVVESLASTSNVDESTVVLSSSKRVDKRVTNGSDRECNDQMDMYILNDELIMRHSRAGSDISSESPGKENGDDVLMENLVGENVLQAKNVSIGETNPNGKDYELKISLPGGNEVGCFVFSDAKEIDRIGQGQSAVNLDHNYHDESRTVSPIVVDRDITVDPKITGATSLRTAKVICRDDRNEESQDGVEPQVPIDNERKFDHQYSRKSNLKHAIVRKGSKVPLNESIVVAKSKNKSDVSHVDSTASRDSQSPKLEDGDDDLVDFDLQVPLQSVLSLISKIKKEDNGQVSNYEFIKIEKAGTKQNVGVITLNRPKTLNAICDKLMRELADAVEKYDGDQTVGAIVITGNEKAFAAGTDIKETMNFTFSQTFKSSFLNHWTAVTRATKPIIAAVNGYALGGGCELAMMCDIIYAGERARFGQPDVVLGHVPSQGGTQRLARIIGKSKTMEMVLTGSQITAQDAEKMGLVSKVFPVDQLLTEAIKLGEKISLNSQLIVAMAKEAVNAAYETTLQEGLRFEKRLSYATFATADLKEGMNAFIEKRAPKFSNQ